MQPAPPQSRSHRLSKVQVTVSAIMALVISLSCSLTSQIMPGGVHLPGSGAPLGLIAYVGLDYNIYTIDRDGKQKKAITQDANPNPGSAEALRIYDFPTWAPNGQNLAYVSFTRTPQATTSASLFTSLSDGTNRVNAFNSPDATPFYLLWSPNSQYVTFLSDKGGAADLDLYLAAAAGGDSKLIGTGNPFYWDWSPDNRAIIVHTGGAISDNPAARLAVIKLNGSVQKQELDLRPGDFQAPAYLPGGDMLLSTPATGAAGADRLVLAGPDGVVKKTLAQLSGPVAFGWSPDGKNLAYTAPLPSDSSGQTNHLIVLNPAKPDQSKEIVQGVVLAFFWSPDSRKIAFFVFDPAHPNASSIIPVQSSPRIALAVQVYDLSSGKISQVASFSPTDAFQQVLPYFDQYQRSGTIWSPDSQDIVLAETDAAGSSGIYVAGVNQGISHKIADGDLAFWAWK